VPLENTKKALFHYKNYRDILDSLNSESNQRASIEEKFHHEYFKDSLIFAKESEISELALEKEKSDRARDKIKNEKRIQKEQSDKQMLFGGIGLMCLLTFVAFLAYRGKRKANLMISLQKEEVETQRDLANEQREIVEEKNKEITDSIKYAKRLQNAILPPPKIVKEWLTDSFLFYKPKDIVAGDFYWMETGHYIEENRTRSLIYFAAADCTGHGVPGAMVSVVCANALNRAVKEFELSHPGQVLDKVSELVADSFKQSEENIRDGMDIALCALDLSEKTLFFSGANNPLYRITGYSQKLMEIHPNSIHDNEKMLIQYKGTRRGIGASDNKTEFETLEIKLEPGDAMYIFSDGFADQFGGENGKKYKYSQFKQFLLDTSSCPMEEQKSLLETEFNDWKRDLEQIDDVCILGIRINGVERKNFTARELETLKHIRAGLSSKMIADKMGITKSTVDTYRKRLHSKTGAHNAAELIKYCEEKEII
jgi:serine phosphatase RsbU (regulator of sigma subunit)/DNA-binding CsgD family transcriptional regulator